MFDSIKDAVEQAVGGVGDGELAGHLQTAADNAQQQGQGDIAQQVTGLISQLQQNPGDARTAIVSFVQSNPQVLQHFAPGFAQGILSKFGV